MARTLPRVDAPVGEFGRPPAKIRREAKQISADQARRTGLNRLESVQIDFNLSALLAAMNFLRSSRI